MPRPSFAEFERECPWLSGDEAEDLVSSGDHAINLNQLRQVAAEMGYEESYYSCVGINNQDVSVVEETDEEDSYHSCLENNEEKAPNSQGEESFYSCAESIDDITSGATELDGDESCHDSVKINDEKISMETLAFEKRLADGTVKKVLYYPRSRYAAVVGFQPHKGYENPGPDEVRVPRMPDGEGNFWIDGWGIVPPADPVRDCGQADGLFNSFSTKSYISYPDTATIHKWKTILTNPLTTTAVFPSGRFERNEWEFGMWPEADGSALFDCAVRWHHIVMAAGYDSSQMAKVLTVCQLMETIVFGAGAVHFGRASHSCGSLCVMTGRLFDFGKEHHGVFAFVMAKQYSFLEDQPLSAYSTSWQDACENRAGFVEEQGELLEQLDKALLALPTALRFDMLTFFLERVSLLFSKVIMLDTDLKAMHGARYQLMTSASLEFSRIFAGDHSEKHYVYLYGLFRSADSRWDIDDASTADTAASDDGEDDFEIADSASVDGEQQL